MLDFLFACSAGLSDLGPLITAGCLIVLGDVAELARLLAMGLLLL